MQGPDGALWYADAGHDTIGRLEADGSVTAFAAGVDGPRALAVGSDGSLWYTAEGGGITRMTVGGVVTTFDVPKQYPIDHPNDIVAGPDGNLWFTGLAYGIGRITTTGVITRFDVQDIDVSTVALTEGPDGALWFVAGSNPGQVGRITTAGALTVFHTGIANYPKDIATGSDGNLWITTDWSLQRVSTGGTVTSFPLQEQSGVIAPGPPGELWFTAPYDHELWRVTTAGQTSRLRAGIDIGGIAADGGGSHWVTDLGGPAIRRIDADGVDLLRRGTITYPAAMASDGNGNLWIVGGDGLVRRTPAGAVSRFGGAELAGLHDIAVDPAGDLWVLRDDSVVRVSTLGAVELVVPITSQYPLQGTITVGPDGNIWLAQNEGISRVTHDGSVTTFTTPTYREPYGLSPGPDGNLWFSDVFGHVGWITPAGEFGTLDLDASVRFEGAPVWGPDGNLWIRGDAGFVRVTPQGELTVFPVDGGAGEPIVGSDGNLWFATGDAIGVMNMAGRVAWFEDRGDARPTALLENQDGLFFISYWAGALGRVETTGTPPGPAEVLASIDGPAVTVTWSPPVVDGGAVIEGYDVLESPGGQQCTWTSGPLACTFTGLTDPSSHRFTVVVHTDAGDASEIACRAWSCAPGNVVATAGHRQATVAWTAPVLGDVPIYNYYVTTLLDGVATGDPKWVDPHVTTVTLTGLTPGAHYRFSVTAVKLSPHYLGLYSQPSEPSNEVLPLAAVPPSAPRGVVAWRGDHTASVYFYVPTDDGGSPITSYTVVASPGGQTATGSTSGIVVSGLSNTGTYTFMVRATNAAGDGPWSAPSAPAAPGVDLGHWFVTSNLVAPTGALTTRFGDGRPQVLACDLTGTHVDHPVTFRDGTWHGESGSGLRESQTSAFTFGDKGDLAVCGDWDGDGKDGIGVFRRSTGTWYLRNSASAGVSSIKLHYGGASNDRAVAGDWDKDGRDEPGVFRSGRWYLADLTGGVHTLASFAYGGADDIPVVGDWNGDGRDGIAVRRTRDARFFLRNEPSAGVATYSWTWGRSTDLPVAYDPEGDRKVGVALVRVD